MRGKLKIVWQFCGDQVNVLKITLKFSFTGVSAKLIFKAIINKPQDIILMEPIQKSKV